MSRRRERILEETTDLVVRLSRDVRRRSRHRRKRRRRVLARLLRAGILMIIAPLVIIPTMIANGWLFGPSGVEGVIAAPLILLASWGALLYWALARRTAPRPLASSEVKQLPAQTDDWLEQQRRSLPWAAHGTLDSINAHLEALAPQLETLDPEQPAAAEIRRLLAEELPELVRGYQAVPRTLRQQPGFNGLTPERQLTEGLTTIDEQLGRVHERLAAEHVNALATHQHYLDLKYKKDGKLE